MTEKAKEPVRLRRKTLTNGNVSLYLAINTGGRREYEFLRLYLIPEKTKADKLRNRDTLTLANSIKAQRIVDIQNGAHGFKSAFKEQTLFFDYYIALTEKRKKKEGKGNFSNWASCLRHLRKYEPRQNITFADITPRWVQGFKDYLENEAEAFGCDNRRRKERRPLSQNSKQSYFNKLRACLRQAYEEGIIRENPMRGILGFSTQEGAREYLSLDEVRALAAAECDYPEIKRAFLFSCLTGLRRNTWISLRKRRSCWATVAMPKLPTTFSGTSSTHRTPTTTCGYGHCEPELTSTSRSIADGTRSRYSC